MATNGARASISTPSGPVKPARASSRLTLAPKRYVSSPV
jgi:hypothetical protein